MSSNVTAKQALAQHTAELAERRSLAAVNTQRRQGLENSISRLIAEQQLDGLDHSQRIAKAREELAEVSGWLKTWPAVESELVRRVGLAQAEARETWKKEMADRLAGLIAAEQELRGFYAAENMKFQVLCQKLRRVLALKDQFINDCFEKGLPLRHIAGTCEMPHTSPIPGTEAAVQAARETYRQFYGEDPKED